MTMLSRNLPVICLMSMSLFVSGCQKTHDAAEPTKPESNVEQKPKKNMPKYLVAVLTYPPYAFRGENGHVQGFDKDILDAIGKKQNFTVEFITHQRDTIFNAINNRELDIIASGMAVSEKRKQMFDVTDSYIESTQVAVVNNPKLKTWQDVKASKFSILKGSSFYKFLISESIPKDHIVEKKTNYLALKEMVVGKVDAVFSEEMSMRYFVNNLDAKNRKNIHFIKPDNVDTAYLVFALRKNRQDDLMTKINTGLKQIKQDGTYQKIVNNWFAEQPIKE